MATKFCIKMKIKEIELNGCGLNLTGSGQDTVADSVNIKMKI